jgi:hypothetical protein
MTPSLSLLSKRRFLPLFATQFLGAFNDNLYKSAMVILVTYAVFNDPTKEATFNAVAGGLFILPFFLFSALAGQLADSMDKARIIRFVKTAEIVIMIGGAAGLLLHNIPLMLAALFAMGIHSSFFGPIKYAVLPQHLKTDEVLGGTGLVEAGTYGAILLGTIAGGLLGRDHAQIAAGGVLVVALIGRLVGGLVPPAPPEADAPPLKMDWHIIRASIRLVDATLHIPRLFLAIAAISFFWAMGAILAAQFPPLVKNVLHADEQVATLFLAIFSIGVAVGSVLINRLLAGRRIDGSQYLHPYRSGGMDHVRPVRSGGVGRHVRRSALRLSHHHRAEVRDRPHRGRQQYRQFGRNGACRPPAHRPRPSGSVGGRNIADGVGGEHRRRLDRVEAPQGLRLNYPNKVVL